MFKIAWRNSIRHRQFTLLNILGLTIGITATLLIALYVIDEVSYDTFHEKGSRIYRINQSMIWGDWDEQFASTGPNLGLALRTDIPEFEEVTRLHSPGGHTVTYRPDEGNVVSFKEDELYVAEENFFDIFSFKAVQGNLETALKEPLSLVITQQTATKFFGSADPIGKILDVRQANNSGPFRVTAVIEDLPTNSHIQFNMLASMSTFQHIKNREWQWIWTTFVTYGLVREGTDVEALEEKIQAIPPKWAATATERVFNQTYEEYMGERQWTLYMQPVREAYLYSPPSGNRIGPSGNSQHVAIFSAIGILILILSSINFMNLSTARSSNRAKEVGIRKVLGSQRQGLVKQFIFESVLFSVVSTLLALIVAEFSLEAFNAIADRELSLYKQLMNPVFAGTLISFMLLLGFLAGSYPAFYLSSFKPVEVLKGKVSAGFKGKGVRNGLVIFQFTISVALIISTFFVQKQLDYAANYDIGFDKENILQIHNVELLSEANKETFQTIVKNNPAFIQTGLSDLAPPNVWNEDKYRAYGPDTDPLTLNRIRANEDYIDLLAPPFILGRNFDETRGTDQYKVILNASAVRALGWGTPETYAEDSPIGKFVTFPSSQEALFEVIGVVEDFNYNSLHNEINPLIIVHEENDHMWESGSDFISMRIDPTVIDDASKLSALIDDVEETMRGLNATVPFEYSFMDQQFEANFRREQQMGQILNIFTVMALSIACLGLFGLAAFSAEQRTKELGVRKVLGAKSADLVLLFSSEFTKMVLISLLIATPVAYYVTKSWLADFAYKTPISAWVFLVAGVGALMISWLTIGVQSLRAANRNPIEALRDE